jgi:hypothetical protein
MMFRLLFVFTFFISSICCAGQIAITDTGDEVILNSDGTWQYSDASASASASAIKTNETSFQKPDGSTFLLKSTRNNSSIYINPKIWSFKKGKEASSDAEYVFELKGGDLYGQVITEEVSMPLETLSNVAFENFKDAAPNGRITKREYRKVNGNKVIYQEMQGNSQGIEFIFSGYYYTNESGSTQLVTYTSTNLLNKYKSNIEDLLNGLSNQ